jgi:hypothetical protein
MISETNQLFGTNITDETIPDLTRSLWAGTDTTRIESSLVGKADVEVLPGIVYEVTVAKHARVIGTSTMPKDENIYQVNLVKKSGPQIPFYNNECHKALKDSLIAQFLLQKTVNAFSELISADLDKDNSKSGFGLVVSSSYGDIIRTGDFDHKAQVVNFFSKMKLTCEQSYNHAVCFFNVSDKSTSFSVNDLEKFLPKDKKSKISPKNCHFEIVENDVYLAVPVLDKKGKIQQGQFEKKKLCSLPSEILCPITKEFFHIDGYKIVCLPAIQRPYEPAKITFIPQSSKAFWSDKDIELVAFVTLEEANLLLGKGLDFSKLNRPKLDHRTDSFNMEIPLPDLDSKFVENLLKQDSEFKAIWDNVQKENPRFLPSQRTNQQFVELSQINFEVEFEGSLKKILINPLKALAQKFNGLPNLDEIEKDYFRLSVIYQVAQKIYKAKFGKDIVISEIENSLNGLQEKPQLKFVSAENENLTSTYRLYKLLGDKLSEKMIKSMQ